MTKVKTFPILYKYTTKGQAQQWTISVRDNSFSTEEGMVGGKLTLSSPTFCAGKNIGKLNETSDHDQAIKEAQAKWQKKVDKGYNTVLTTGSKFFEPMLADDYKKVKVDFTRQKVFVQPKLDGLRCINTNDSLMSRNGKPYLACPHLQIDDDMEILDGELYNHKLKADFNKIVSLCKKQKPTEEELEESAKKVQFWAYDFPGHIGIFSERYKALRKYIKSLDNKSIILVPTFQVKSEEDIKEWHEYFLSKGYEGTIVRIDAPYENKRTKVLLKYKDFIDEEFEIVGYEEGTGGRAGTIGKFILRHDKDKARTFDSNVKGTFDYLRDLWKNKEKYIGKSATVKYFQRTPKKEDGGDVPRFPYIIKISREDYE